MPQASRNEKKLRRVRQELSATRKMLQMALAQRDYARLIATGLEEELKKFDPVEKSKVPSYTMEKIPDEPLVSTDHVPTFEETSGQ